MSHVPGQESDVNDFNVSSEQSFFNKSSGVRLVIVVSFVISLFVFLHFREVRVEVLELGSVAPSYVVSQLDFDFFDEEASIILRQEAVRDIGKIYKLADTFIRQRRMEFENYLIYNQDWREEAEQSTFEEMYRGLDLLEKSLMELRFTDPRTLRKMDQVNLDTQEYQIYTPVDVSEEVELPDLMWDYVKEATFQDTDIEIGTVDFILKYFRDRRWKLEEDIASQRLLRRQVQSYVPDKYTHVSAGKRIIDQGEKVTTRHIAMLQAMKKTLSETRNLWHPATLAGSIVMTALLTLVSVFFLRIIHPDIAGSNRKLFLLVTIVVLTLVLSKIFEFFMLTSTTTFADAIRFPLLTPFAAIMLCSLLHPNIAAFGSVMLTVVLSLVLIVDRSGFLVTNIVASIVVILGTRSLKRRKEIFYVCGLAWVACILVVASLHLYENKLWEISAATDLFSSLLFMLGTAVLAVGLLPLLESTFDVMTDATLIEYMDPNQELLRRLAIEAPGTYQHSVVVGNLAEAGALAIGANGLFCRVSALYHDIGKLATPQYFTENQQGGMNIHQLLTPKESAQVIISHVREAVAMARKASLPEQFIDIIKEHHGTTLTYYFYRKELEQIGGDESAINDKEFRYHGPKPRGKESAIIMIADSLEAASRSLEEINDESLTKLVDSLVRQKYDDGQFDHCLLTFEELGIVKKAMVKTLLAAGHARIKYPTREQEK